MAFFYKQLQFNDIVTFILNLQELIVRRRSLSLTDDLNVTRLSRSSCKIISCGTIVDESRYLPLLIIISKNPGCILLYSAYISALFNVQLIWLSEYTPRSCKRFSCASLFSGMIST